MQIDQLTMETYEENDLSGIPELIEVVRLQDSGPQEASRAIRKKLSVILQVLEVVSKLKYDDSY